jgi:type I restriction enzyme R subunit
MADSKEAQFQQDIITAMVAQGWLTGPASGYDWRTLLETEEASL